MLAHPIADGRTPASRQRHPRRSATRTTVAAIALVLLAALTAACGSPSKNNNAGNAANSSTDLTGAKIQFGGWGMEEATTKSNFQGFVDSFNSATKADATMTGWPYQDVLQQLVLKAKSHQAPDVAQLDMNWVTTFASQGQLVDLNQVYGADKLAALYPQNYLRLGQRDGAQVALPWTIASISMVANMDILNKAGITQMPATTDEFAADLAKIKQTQPDVIPYALDTKTPALVTPFFQPWLWTFGGTVVKDGKVAVNSAGTAGALRYLSGLVKQNLIQKDVDIFSARTLFAQGKVAFYDDAIIAKGLVAAANKPLADKVMPVARPVANAGDAPQSIQWGHVLVMFKNDRSGAQNAAAAAFITHLETPATADAYFTSQGLLPATTEGLKSATTSSDAYQKTWANITATSRLDETAAYVGGAQISTIVGQHAQAAYLGIETPEQAAKAMSDELGQINLK